ncbi:putative caveolin-2-like [Scophthalmus maximus]|uniref:Caveolin n=1 Tax=Scophthalmus maximus TaxID=52904 RepID=A0A2U9BZV1_SCOMX|nr:putative caveolin-2-like [Scophthalmus maximus]
MLHGQKYFSSIDAADSPSGVVNDLWGQDVEVSDVLAEPAAPRSIDKVWLYSVTGFEKTRSWTYHGLTLLLAVPFALLCGVFLAILACLHVCQIAISLSNKDWHPTGDKEAARV